MTEAPAGLTGPSRLPKPAWTLVLASLGLFMSALDNMVVTATAGTCAVILAEKSSQAAAGRGRFSGAGRAGSRSSRRSFQGRRGGRR